ncbi:MAG: HEPN domain-containing protein [Kineosporiaceae bacterium]
MQALLGERKLQRVVADPRAASRLMQAAERHLAAASVAAEVDRDGAYSLAYDAARKSAVALLAQQGLRPTARGGHYAVVRVMEAQFPGVEGLSSMDRLRRRRNEVEYPDLEAYDAVDDSEVQEAIAVAGRCLASARRLLDEGGLVPFPD